MLIDRNPIRSRHTAPSQRPANPAPAPQQEAAAPQDSATLGGASQPASQKVDFKSGAIAARAAELEQGLSEHVESQLLVKVGSDASADDLDALCKDYGAKLVHRFDLAPQMLQSFDGQLLQIQLPPGVSTAEGMAAMENDQRIAYAAANDKLEAYGSAQPVVPDDLDTQLWGLNNANGVDVNAPEAWATTTGSRNGPVIAVIDTGVDYSHPDLVNNMWTNPGEIPGNGVDDDGNGVIDDVHGYNAINNSGDPMDDHAHGTHCAGTIGAEGNNGQGVVGVNWQAQIMGGKFLSASGGGTTADAIKAVSYATRNGARITSNSWGGGGFNQALYDAFGSSPALHICAAGNESNNNDNRAAYPASYDLPNIVSVAAIDSRGGLASFSNYGAETVDVAAPGVGILSTVRNGRYSKFSGTSMACPHVSGVAGLIATAYPDISNEELKERLLSTATQQDNLQGKVASGGRVDAAAALESDDTPPAAPGELAGQAASFRQVNLSWVAPGDDGVQGVARGYDIRYSSQPIDSEEAFQNATRVPSPEVRPAGERQQLAVDVAPSEQQQTLHFAIKAFDNFNNESTMSNVSVAVPAGVAAFDGAGAGDFAPEDNWAQTSVDGRTGVWTDSPAGNHAASDKTSLVTQPFDLRNVSNATLVFDSKLDLGSGDKLLVEVHNGGWFSWYKDMAELEGDSDWSKQVIDLSDFDGDDVRVRFRLISDNFDEGDGVYLDNVKVIGDTATGERGGCFNS